MWTIYCSLPVSRPVVHLKTLNYADAFSQHHMQAYDAVQLFAPVREALFVLGGVLLAAAVALDEPEREALLARVRAIVIHAVVEPDFSAQR